MQHPKSHLLIDGDILVWKALCVHEYEFRWETDQHSLMSDTPKALKDIDAKIRKWKKLLNAKTVTIALSSPTNFRKDVYKEYKANRKDVRKPVGFVAAREYVKDTYETVSFDGIEADDVLGILSTDKEYKKNYRKVIVSIDKDFKAIPGFYYNPDKDDGVVEFTEQEADINFYIQSITGDTVDNYKGIPGIGATKAAKLLADVPQDKLFDTVMKLFLDNDLTEEYALAMMRCARILRSEDWDKKTKQPILFRS